jgi:hypothetical protein
MESRLYGHITLSRSLSNALKLKPAYNVRMVLVQMKAATAKDIAEHGIRPAKVIPASLVLVSYGLLLISILRLCMDLMKMIEWWTKWQVGKKLIVVLM